MLLASLSPKSAMAYNVAKGLDGVKYSIGSAITLYQSMLLEVLIHKEGVQCGGIKACEEHIHNDEQIHLPVFHSQ